ncbi:MAG: GNAT family N-acetyltransferase, partial [Candidatus Hydrogenedentes bacterium]|nr:GNAT family N-acetyltransferase [Candidatus Hydrogenedentota bacterium]
LQEFSGKSRKKLRRELDALENLGLAFRYDCLADAERVFEMNLAAFGADSYFHDARFLDGFAALIRWLHDEGLLRVTCVLLGGRIAAVDVGAVWRRTYTLVAGGTCPDFPGVAKLINFHHLERSCQERYEVVDFLCGDFGWKERFHLTPRPLYQLRLSASPRPVPAAVAGAPAYGG